MKKKYTVIIGIIVFIIATVTISNIILNGNTILKHFNITNVSNIGTNYTIDFEKVNAAHHYNIIITDEYSNKVFDLETKKTTNEIELTNLEYDVNYTVSVIAYDKDSHTRKSNNNYNFKWTEPSFSDDNLLLLHDQDYLLIFNGKMPKDKYHLEIKSNGKILEDKVINENEYMINKDYYVGKKVILEVNLKHKDTVIDTINLYNNINPVSNLKITYPKDGAIIPYSDVSINFEGGDNATEYIVSIYEDKNKIKEATIRKKQCIISKKVFATGHTYRIVITAKYDDYKKNAEFTFTMSDKEQLKPVYISNNWQGIKKGSKLVLSSPDKDAKIYYTLDGTNPESLGQLYTEPIIINDNVILKTVAMNDTKLNSIVSTYDVTIGKKKQLKVYISPSNQYGNLGVSSTGYTNERDEMNELSNYIIERLKQYGVKIYRNNSSGNINAWLRDSNYLGVDLHIAIHSNASLEHDKYGVETWIHTDSSKTYSLANQIQKNLVTIYPYRDLEGANRGVKYANGALGEVNDNYLPFGILLEIAHHDNEKDAKWIVDNKKLIGYNIADSILRYYQIID